MSELNLSNESQNALASKDLIANESVISIANNAIIKLSQSLMRLMVIKSEEAKLAIDLNFLDKRISNLIQENKNINEKMTNLRESGLINRDISDYLIGQLDSNGKLLSEEFDEQSKKILQKQELVKILHSQSIEELVGLYPLITEVIIAIRGDLQITTNEESFRGFMNDSIKQTQQDFSKYTEQIFKTFEIK